MQVMKVQIHTHRFTSQVRSGNVNTDWFGLRSLIYGNLFTHVFETPIRIRKMFACFDGLCVNCWRIVNLYETHTWCVHVERYTESRIRFNEITEVYVSDENIVTCIR